MSLDLGRRPGERPRGSTPQPAGTAGKLPHAGLVVLVVLTGTWIAVGIDMEPVPRLVLLCAALAAFAGVALLAHQDRLPLRATVAAVGVLLAVAVAVPPQFSGDLWAYNSFGRMVSVEGTNPYTSSIEEFPDDPFVDRVGEGHRDSPSVYGPAFVAIAAAGAPAAGDSPLAARLFHQGLAALAVAGVVIVLVRLGLGPGAAAFAGLNPAVALLVNGGHNDALVGLGVLAGVVLAARRRPAVAGLAFAFAALVKLPALLPAAAVAAWLWRRHGLAPAARLGATVGATVVLAYLAVGGPVVLEPLDELGDQLSRASPWRLLVELAEVASPTWVPTAAGVTVVALVAALAWRLRGRRSPGEPAAAAGLAYLVAAPYVLAWYPGSVFPAAALAWRSRVAVLVQVQAALLVLAYVEPAGTNDIVILDPLWYRWVPALTVVVALALTTWASRPSPPASR